MSIHSTRTEKILRIVVLLAFLTIWELLADFKIIDPFFVSSPLHIIQSAQWLFANGLWNDIRVSLAEFLWGMGLAVIFGIALGWLLGWYRTLNVMVEPMIAALNAAPRVALLPLLILCLGIGIESKVAAVFMGAFFPIVFNVMKGVSTIDKNLLQLSRSFGANDLQVFTSLGVPSSLPFLMAGLNIAIGRGLVGVFLGELIGGQAGVGFMMVQAGATFQTDKVFVGLVLLTGFGYALTELIKFFEKRFEKWRY